MPIGLYIHVPFCIQKCHYCDFTSYPVKEQEVNRYLDSVQREMGLYFEGLSSEQKKLASIYIGGGTPTCLSSGQLFILLESLHKVFEVPESIEFTVEANPGTVTKDKLAVLKSFGVNRMSIGTQSFEDRCLKGLGRIHTGEETREAFYLAREAGFDNLSLDLIFALPGQRQEDWLNTLHKTIELSPEHISAYGLKVEEGTLFYQLQKEDKLSLPSEDAELEMYQDAIKLLAAKGYSHYEISNFAQPGKKSKHNLLYWHNQEYLGLGPGAHSFLNKTRWANYGDLDLYNDHLKGNTKPVDFKEIVNLKQEMAETVFMGLRLRRGISLDDFSKRFNISLEEVYGKEIDKLLDQGLVIMENGLLRLTDRGLPLANLVFQEFV